MKTGYQGDEDILKNIFDLEANHHEWTAQRDEYGRAVRGGSFSNFAQDSSYPAAAIYEEGYNLNSVPSDTTSRIVLCIK